jgi:4-hydroxybenzoate polyprenyltransferase
MKDLLLHLRLNMSLVLAPIFMWGFFLAKGVPDFKFFTGFVALHIFLYGSSNAYNSYYDKDEGPIGGLKNPPKVTDSLLYFSLIIKFSGLIISFFINWQFVVTYIIFALLSIIYSHPVTRWKANPYLSILTVGLGQGGIAFIAGWFCAIKEVPSWPIFITGIFTTIFMSMGVYPLTQLYQIEEDKKRKDKTFAVHWGITKSFKFSSYCIFISAISMLSVLFFRNNFFDLWLIGAFYLVFLTQVSLWARNFKDKDIMKNYHKIMKLNYINGLGFTIFILLHFIKVL